MATFVMIGWDGLEGPDRRDVHRRAHVDHITSLDRSGRIVFAGPIRDDTGAKSIGAVIVFGADDLDEARRTVDSDPYVAGGVFKTVSVSPFKTVLPESK